MMRVNFFFVSGPVVRLFCLESFVQSQQLYWAESLINGFSIKHESLSGICGLAIDVEK